MGGSVVSPPVVKTRALFCPNCGAAVELRGFGHTLTVVCAHCLSVLDASTPLVRVLQQLQEAVRRTPTVPLGSRGRIHDTLWELIGFQVRGYETEGEHWEWNEYVLFNPYKGFRYLTEYRGHWNFVEPVRALPREAAVTGRKGVTLGGVKYRHFQNYVAGTEFVLGEFPWQVRVGERVTVDDYVAPPLALSAETTPDEVTWSKGEYMTSAEIWRAFQLQGAAPRAAGVYSNQPSPYAGKVGRMWRMMLLMWAALLVLAIYFAGFSPHREVFREKYSFSPSATGEPSFVTDIFDLNGRTAGLELRINTDLNNDWAYFNLALINATTGAAYDFGREVSYYYGADSDGSWSEGGKNDDVIIPSVPPGRYYLRVEPEMDKAKKGINSVNYEIILTSGAVAYSFFWIAALLLLIPPILYGLRAHGFERARWAESDYPMGGSS